MRNQDKNDVTSILFHRRGRPSKEVRLTTPQNRQSCLEMTDRVKRRCSSVAWVQCFVNRTNSFI